MSLCAHRPHPRQLSTKVCRLSRMQRGTDYCNSCCKSHTGTSVFNSFSTKLYEDLDPVRYGEAVVKHYQNCLAFQQKICWNVRRNGLISSTIICWSLRNSTTGNKKKTLCTAKDKPSKSGKKHLSKWNLRV